MLIFPSYFTSRKSFAAHPPLLKAKQGDPGHNSTPPGFQVVAVYNAAHHGSEQQSCFLKPYQLSPGIWQVFPLLLIFLAQTFCPFLLPWSAASSPPPITNCGEASRMGKVIAKCHHLLSTLISWVLHS